MIWKINTFGSFRLFYQQQQLGAHLSRTSKALISLLAAHQSRSVTREEIACLLWSTEYDKAAQHRLSTILWRLRHLGDSGAQTTTRQLLLIEPSGDVRINGRDVVEIDLVDFEAAVKRCHIRRGQASADDVAVLTRCVDLYAGDFLRDLDLEWVAEKRQYLRQCYLDILQFLVEYHNDVGRYDEVITYADRFLRVDPYLEAIHVFMIKACLSTGRRSLAAARAQACRRAFTEELGVAIEGEAQRLISCLASTSSSQSKARTKCQVDRRASQRVDDRSLVQLREACSQVVSVCSTLLHEASDREPGAAAFQSHPPRKSVER